jgi:hypothetical protein
VRLAAGFLAYDLVLAAVGMALLYAAGLVAPRPVRLALAAPLALVSGAAVAAVLGTIALTAGLALDAAPDTAVLLVLAAVLVVVGRRRRQVDEAGEALRPSAPGLALAAVVGLYVLVQAALSRHVPPAWDSAHNWYLKAVALSDHIGLSGAALFTSNTFAPAHLTYPLAHPVLGGLLFQYIGDAGSGRLIAELWILLGATALSAPFLAAGGRRGWLALVPFALTVVAATSVGVLQGDADVTMACFLGVGALCLGRWLDDGPPGLLAPAVVCLAAAANTKNEGLVFTACVLAAALVATLVAARARALLLVGAGACVAVLSAPWLLWVHFNGPFATDVTPLSTSLHLHFLRSQVSLLDFAAREVIGQVVNTAAYYWLFPLALVLCGLLVAAGPRRRVAGFYLGAVLAAVAALLWVYWTTTGADAAGHVQRTVIRTVTGPLFLCAAALAHLLPRLAVAPRRPDPDEAGDAAAWHH